MVKAWVVRLVTWFVVGSGAWPAYNSPSRMPHQIGQGIQIRPVDLMALIFDT